LSYRGLDAHFWAIRPQDTGLGSWRQ